VRSVIDHVWREETHSAPLKAELHPQPLPVLLERVQVERALANVLTNAFKYTPSSGQITVRTLPHDTYALVSVNNTGTNIDQTEIAGLFARYQRASTSAGKGGSGLGLYIVKTILDTCGGKVELTSSVKDGVTFSLFFPLAKGERSLVGG
jgi:signal transduction histidine kinase